MTRSILTESFITKRIALHKLRAATAAQCGVEQIQLLLVAFAAGQANDLSFRDYLLDDLKHAEAELSRFSHD